MDLYEQLASTDWRRRQQAIEALSGLEAADLARALLGIVREQNENLAALNAALQALLKLRRAPLEEILQLFADGDEQVRIYVPPLLGMLGDARAVPALVSALEDPSPNVRFNAAEALGELRARQAAGALIEHLHGDDLFVRYAAVLALGKIGASPQAGEEERERITAELLPLLNVPTLDEPAVTALGLLGRPLAIPAILRWLEKGDAGAPDAGMPEAGTPEAGTASDVGGSELPGSPRPDDGGSTATDMEMSRGGQWLGGETPPLPESPPAEAASDVGAAPPLALTALGQILRRSPGARLACGPRAAQRLVRQAGEILDTLEPEESTPVNGAHIAAARGEDSALVQDAAEVLAALLREAPSAAPVRGLLVRLLAYSSARAVSEAALSHAPRPAPLELIAALDSPDVEQAVAAARVLAALRDPAALPALVTALDGADAVLAAHAALALGELDDPTAVEALLARLDAPEAHLRRAVTEALGRRPTPALAERLSGLRQSEQPHLREAAVRLLVGFNLRGARPAQSAGPGSSPAVLASDAPSSDASTSDASSSAASSPDASSPGASSPEISATDASVTDAAASAASATGAERVEATDAARAARERYAALAAAAAEGALADPDLAVRRAALEVIAQAGSPQAAGALQAALAEPNAALRAAAARGLAHLAPGQALPLLERALQDADMRVRAAACRALGGLNHPEALPLLLAALGDRLPPVRLAALQALTALAGPAGAAYPDPAGLARALEHARGLLEDEDEAVRAAAQSYLNQAAEQTP